jgi:hypothetical protein
VTDGAKEDAREPLTTKEGWARFVNADPIAPPVLSRGEVLALDEEALAAHDKARLDYHTRLAIVATPAIRQVASVGRRLVLLNRHQVSAAEASSSPAPPAAARPRPSPNLAVATRGPSAGATPMNPRVSPSST